MGEIAWTIWAVLIVVSAVVGWVGSDAMKRQWRQEGDDQETPSTGLHLWGQPDLAPPSTSLEAQAEVAELEALWRQSRTRRR